MFTKIENCQMYNISQDSAEPICVTLWLGCYTWCQKTMCLCNFLYCSDSYICLSFIWVYCHTIAAWKFLRYFKKTFFCRFIFIIPVHGLKAFTVALEHTCTHLNCVHISSADYQQHWNRREQHLRPGLKRQLKLLLQSKRLDLYHCGDCCRHTRLHVCITTPGISHRHK